MLERNKIIGRNCKNQRTLRPTINVTSFCGFNYSDCTHSSPGPFIYEIRLHKMKVLIKGHYFIISKLFATSCPLPHRINLQGLQPASWTFGRAAGSYKGYWSDKFMTLLIILSISSMSYYLRPWHRLGVFYVLKFFEANKLWRRGKQMTDSEKNKMEPA